MNEAKKIDEGSNKGQLTTPPNPPLPPPHKMAIDVFGLIVCTTVTTVSFLLHFNEIDSLLIA